MKLLSVLRAIAALVVFFFAVIFAWAASYAPQVTASRLASSLILFVIGLALVVIVFYLERKPKTVIQKVEISGQMKAAPIKCPNCGASVDADTIKIISGVPYATCPYCGKTFEVTEEPKW
jgi:hypothetical protein